MQLLLCQLSRAIPRPHDFTRFVAPKNGDGRRCPLSNTWNTDKPVNYGVFESRVTIVSEQLMEGCHPRPGGEGGVMQAPGDRREQVRGSSTAAAEIAPDASYTLPTPIAHKFEK